MVILQVNTIDKCLLFMSPYLELIPTQSTFLTSWISSRAMVWWGFSTENVQMLLVLDWLIPN